MAEEQKTNLDQEPGSETQQSGTEKAEKTKSSGGSAFEGIYDQLPDISVKSLDKFILLCVVVLVAVIVLGVLQANHVFG